MEAKEAMENWNRGISELFSIICKKRRAHSVGLRCGAVNTKMERKGRKSKKYGS